MYKGKKTKQVDTLMSALHQEAQANAGEADAEDADGAAAPEGDGVESEGEEGGESGGGSGGGGKPGGLRGVPGQCNAGRVEGVRQRSSAARVGYSHRWPKHRRRRPMRTYGGRLG